MAAASVHPFERAGLGLAPFRVVGMIERRGPINTVLGGVLVSVGAPGQPMGSCKFCGIGIAYCFVVRSSDKREFEVGSDCVARTRTEILPAVKRQVAKAERERVQARVDARVGSARVSLEREDVRAVLRARSTNYGTSTGRRQTVLAWAEWMLAHAGRKGQTLVAQRVEAVVAELAENPLPAAVYETSDESGPLDRACQAHAIEKFEDGDGYQIRRVETGAPCTFCALELARAAAGFGS